MPLCSDCCNIDLRPLVEAAYLRSTKTTIKPGWEELTPDIIPHIHPKTRFEMRDNAEECDCCKVFWDASERYIPGRDGPVLIYVLFDAFLDPIMPPSMVVRIGHSDGSLSDDINMYKHLCEGTTTR